MEISKLRSDTGRKMGLFTKKWESELRLEGKTAIITGCNTGLGKCVACEFYKRGCRVIMACRDLSKAQTAKDDITESSKDSGEVGILVVEHVDLASLKSIRDFADRILRREAKINILVNNAGVMGPKRATTSDGHELQFGTNHLGHFLLTLQLLNKMIDSAPSRILNVSSVIHSRGETYGVEESFCWPQIIYDDEVEIGGKINFKDLNSLRSYSRIGAYAQSKLAIILFTKELARRLEGTKVTVYALHPGMVRTEIGRYIGSTSYAYYNKLCRGAMRAFFKPVEKGVRTYLYCALDEDAGTQSGLYYKNCRPIKPSPRAMDMETAKMLWDVSLKMCGMDYDPTLRIQKHTETPIKA